MISHLGLTIDTIFKALTLPKEKLQPGSVSQLSKYVSVRDLSRLIGMISATTLAVLLAPLYYRGLQELKIRTLARSQSFETMVCLNEKTREELG